MQHPSEIYNTLVQGILLKQASKLSLFVGSNKSYFGN